MNWNHYFTPRSVEDALRILSETQQSVCPIGGGTDLLLEIQQGHRPPVDTLVDLTRIAELHCLEVRQDVLFIGAAIPVSEIAVSPLVRSHAQAVCEACSLIGGPQVRNSATLGGNVAHALPAADGMISLVAMDAVAEIATLDGRRRAPILSLFSGPGKTSLDLRREFLVGFHIPVLRENEGSCFSRIMRPQGVALPILNMAAWVKRQGDCIHEVRIAVGPAGPTPQRARAVESFLNGCIYNSANIQAADEIWQTSMRFRTSPQRATAEYRHHLSKALFEKVLAAAWQRSFSSTAEA
jgi:xanthine dehydrogenase FAD-binding subunit